MEIIDQHVDMFCISAQWFSFSLRLMQRPEEFHD